MIQSGKAEGPFDILAYLGGGGFADAYQARVLEPKLSKKWGTEIVAIKVPKNKEKEIILIRELVTSSFVTQTLRELSGAVNVVKYFDVEFYDGRYVMVMEFAPDGSLRRLMGKAGQTKPLPVGQVIHFAQGILAGLAAIHGTGVFHRDIKPENILLDRDVPKIGDLGIATMLLSNEQASSTVGTLAYMSPETLGVNGAEFRSDLWSVGVTLYEMLTGRWPFGDDATPIQPMVNLICNCEPEAPRKLRPEIPERLNNLVLRALRKRPAERFSSAEEMLRELGDDLEERLRALRPLLLSPESWDAAEASLAGLIREHPDDPRPYRQMGELYNRSLRTEAAVPVFRKGLEADPKNAILHFDLGVTLRNLGRKREAVQSLRMAIQCGLEAGLQGHARRLLDALEREAR